MIGPYTHSSSIDISASTRIRVLFHLLLVLILAFGFFLPPTPVFAASIAVTTVEDSLDAAVNCSATTVGSLPGPDGKVSLREAICAANSNSDMDTITFAVDGIFYLTGAINEDNGNTGDLDIKHNIAIEGNGVDKTIIDGSNNDRIFDAFPGIGIIFNLSRLTIQNGNSLSSSLHGSGAIYLHNNVTADFSEIQVINNISRLTGAIENRGTLTISKSVISNNQVLIHPEVSADAVMGGGLMNKGTLTVTQTTISNNSIEGHGGGIASIQDTTTTIENSTISGNRADGNGGGIYVEQNANAILNNVTITNNIADDDNNGVGAGGGLSRQDTASVTLRNTLVAGNFNSTSATRDDVSAHVVSTSSYNLIGDDTGLSGISNDSNSNQIGSAASPIDPLLGSLSNNSGPTETHALLPGSPARNAGYNATCSPIDQRGVPRPGEVTCDIGSYEANDVVAPQTTLLSTPPSQTNSTSATFTFTGSDDQTSPGSLSFECQIDGGAFSACISPRTYPSLSEGSHIFEVRATDLWGNTDPTPASYTWVIDQTAPTVANVTSSAANGSYTIGATIDIQVVFNEDVVVTNSPQLTLDIGSPAAIASYLSGSGSNSLIFRYTVVAGHASADLDYLGTGALALNGGTIRDTAGNNAVLTLPAPGATNSLGANKAIEIDTASPSVTITSSAPNPTNSSPIPVTVTFSESVSDFTTADIVPVNGTVQDFSGSGSTYTFNVVPAGQGLVTADIAAGVAQDAAGNGNTAASQFSRTYDSVAPSVSMTSSAPNPTNSSPIPVTVTFSESVSDFTAADIVPGNGTVEDFSGSGSSYTFNLVPAGQGLVTADIAAGVAQDAAGNGNTAASQFSITYDSIAPTVTVEQAASQADPIGLAPINFTVTFSEPVTGFGDSPADVTISGTAGATTATVTGSGTSYNVAISGMTGNGTVIVNIPAGAAQDAASNPNASSTSSDNSVTFDPLVPVVTGIVRADSDPTNAASLRFIITFAKSVTGVDASDFALDASGLTGASITGVTGSGNTRTVTVATGSGDGTLRLDLVDDDTIVDAASNPLGGPGAGNGSFSSGQAYTIDKTVPTAGNLLTPPVLKGDTTYTFTLVFSDNLAIDIASLGSGNIRVSGPNGFNQLATLLSVDPATDGSPRTATYQITAPNGTWSSANNGNYSLNLEPNQVRDTVGNAAASTSLGSFSINLLHQVYLPMIIHPAQPDLVVQISLDPDQRSFAAGAPLLVSVTVTNQGSAPATGFWVDLMINPSRVPDQANTLWNEVCTLSPCQGIAWYVPETLAPGASITLSSAKAPKDFSNWPGFFMAGTTDLYAYVDSWKPNTASGAQQESNETNNRAHLGGLKVTGPNPNSTSAQPALPIQRPALLP